MRRDTIRVASKLALDKRVPRKDYLSQFQFVSEKLQVLRKFKMEFIVLLNYGILCQNWKN
jgi:hypothetical protein